MTKRFVRSGGEIQNNGCAFVSRRVRRKNNQGNFALPFCTVAIFLSASTKFIKAEQELMGLNEI